MARRAHNLPTLSSKRSATAVRSSSNRSAWTDSGAESPIEAKSRVNAQFTVDNTPQDHPPPLRIVPTWHKDDPGARACRGPEVVVCWEGSYGQVCTAPNAMEGAALATW